jgi:hypothetical protein
LAVGRSLFARNVHLTFSPAQGRAVRLVSRNGGSQENSERYKGVLDSGRIYDGRF